jgi:hypothetical protein
MTEFDFTRRVSDLSVVIRRIDSLIKLLSNETAYQARLTKLRERREQRAQKAREKQARLEQRGTPLVPRC